jgi:serine phosphatase RsbU (regulator of sigma subunit)
VKTSSPMPTLRLVRDTDPDPRAAAEDTIGPLACIVPAEARADGPAPATATDGAAGVARPTASELPQPPGSFHLYPTVPLPTALSDAAAPTAPAVAPAVVPDATIERRVDQVQVEIDALRHEVGILRRRDETLKFYMHRLDEELRLAARLQQDFLPKSLPQVGKVHFHTLFRPAGYVSGDLYDVMRLDEHHVGFYMADAVGHGMPAALLTMFLKNALITKEITPSGYRLLPPGQSMARLNAALVDQNLSQATFATALYGSIDTQTLRLTFARGGHPSPILITGDGRLTALEADGSLLGIFPGEQFAETSVDLKPGDRVFVYSDGIEVAFSGDETTDMTRWRDELYARREMSTEDLITDFAQHLDGEAGSLTPKDDLTMIVVEVK